LFPQDESSAMAPTHATAAIDIIVFLTVYRPSSVLKKPGLEVLVEPDSRQAHR
jgi:hypothetical protein